MTIANGNTGTPALPWDHLTPEEQRILAPKLVPLDGRSELTEDDLLRASLEFNRGMIEGDPQTNADPEKLAVHLLTLRNFLEQARAYRDGALWREVASLKGVRRSYLELTVRDRDRLLRLLATQNFVVNREPFWTIHKFDSARGITRFSHEPSLHFANDRANEPGYGPNYFFVHWDVASPIFREASWWRGRVPGMRYLEMLYASWRHRSGFASPELVRSYLPPEGSESTVVLT